MIPLECYIIAFLVIYVIGNFQRFVKLNRQIKSLDAQLCKLYELCNRHNTFPGWKYYTSEELEAIEKTGRPYE